jgi:hypothetical protein
MLVKPCEVLSAIAGSAAPSQLIVIDRWKIQGTGCL